MKKTLAKEAEQHQPTDSWGGRIRRLHTEKQEAERLGFSPRTFQQWRHKGGGPPFLKINKAVRYDPDVVDEWLSRRARMNTADPGPEAA